MLTSNYDRIVDERYIILGHKTTVCFIQLLSGFEIVGVSACVDPTHFNKDLGEQYAKQDAMRQLMILQGYSKQLELFNIKGEKQDETVS